MISALVLTRNEQADLPGCLASLAWSDDVHVYDSFSTDDTVAVAKAHGARVTQRTFDNYAAQRNAALHGLDFRHPWVLILDADERITPGLAAELRAFVRSAPDGVAGGRMRRRDFLYGTWLRHAQASAFYIRLVRPASARYEREVNEVLRVDGEIRNLGEPFDHYPFSKGMAHWFAKHNQYSSMEAHEVLKVRSGETTYSLRAALTHRDFNSRRYHQKQLFYRLPARPLLKFALLYFAKRGFLDGRAGLAYALLQSIYEYMIVLKTRELESAARVPPPVTGGPTRPRQPA